MTSHAIFVSFISIKLSTVITDAYPNTEIVLELEFFKASLSSKTEFSAVALVNSPPNKIFLEISSKTTHTCLPATVLLIER